MTSFLGKLSWGNVVMLGMGTFILWAVLSHPDIEFTYYRSTKPLPNQRFARVAFLVAGTVLVLLGIWSLWIDLHTRSSHLRILRHGIRQLSLLAQD
jgi:uncharacterized membrane protein